MLRRSVFGLAASTPRKGRPLTEPALAHRWHGMAWHGALRVLLLLVTARGRSSARFLVVRQWQGKLCVLVMLGPNVIPYDWIY
jgi:hypothetical protein